MDKDTVLKLAIATLYHAKIVKGAADAFIHSEEFSKETLATDAELSFSDLDVIWEALPQIQKCLRHEIPDILNTMQEKLDHQFQLGQISGFAMAARQVMQEATDTFKRGGKDSNAVALREAAEHLQERVDTQRYKMGLQDDTPPDTPFSVQFGRPKEDEES
jgi:hypothetical protein